jgi:hypothetical protein
MALSQAAIVAADIDPEMRSVSVAVHAESYIPQRLLNQAARDIASLYGLRQLNLTATHPETELHKMEPEELLMLFLVINIRFLRKEIAETSSLKFISGLIMVGFRVCHSNISSGMRGLLYEISF